MVLGSGMGEAVPLLSTRAVKDPSCPILNGRVTLSVPDRESLKKSAPAIVLFKDCWSVSLGKPGLLKLKSPRLALAKPVAMSSDSLVVRV